MKSSLQFHNNQFRIMLVGDPHENNDLSTEENRRKTEDYLALQYAAVNKLKPDLVVLMGDNATGETTEELREVLMRITAPYRESGIPFAFILGNHDLECEVNDLKTQYGVYRTLPCCILPGETDVNEYGDYNLLVKSTDGKKNVLNLWFTYSGNKAEAKYNSYYDFVKTEQIDYYKKKAALISKENGGIVPAVNFQHIPVPEEYKLLDKVSPLYALHDAVEGQNGQKGNFYRLKKDVKGYMGEGICPSDYNNGQFDAWKETGDIFASFFGHDHMNDFVGEVDGILLGQCKTSGFRVYGDGLRQGVRVLDFTESVMKAVATEMVRYRDLIGSSCNSISGINMYPDRITTKLDAFAKIAPYAGGVAALALIIKILGKIRGRR